MKAFKKKKLKSGDWIQWMKDSKKYRYPVGKVVEDENKNGFVKIYLATPAIFKNGSLPEFISKGSYEGIEFELLNMAIGKPIFIGGFDMKKRQPKPMKKAVPAGSVYYLRSNKAQELASKLHSKSISEINPEQGFGICYCGTFNISEL